MIDWLTKYNTKELKSINLKSGFFIFSIIRRKINQMKVFLNHEIDQYFIQDLYIDTPYNKHFYFYFRNYNCLLLNMKFLNNLNCRQRRETYDRVEKVRNQFLKDIEDFQKHKIDFINNRLVLDLYNPLFKNNFLIFFNHPFVLNHKYRIRQTARFRENICFQI